MPAGLVALLLLVAPVDSAGVAFDGAPSASERLERGRAAYDTLEYVVATEELQAVVLHPDATDEELREAHMLAGVIQRILGRDVDARMHFREALKVEPGLELPPGQPPKVQVFFEMVKKEVADDLARSAPGEAAEPPVQLPSTAATDPSTAQISLLLVVAASAGALAALAVLATAGSMAAAVAAEVVFFSPSFPTSARSTARLLTLPAWGGAVLFTAVFLASAATTGVAAGLWAVE